MPTVPADPWEEFRTLPAMLTPEQVKLVLNLDSMKAVYTRKERGQIPGVLQISKRRWRVRKAVLLRSLSPQGHATTPDQES